MSEYRMPRQKGTYVAQIVGPHGRFGLEREFMSGRRRRDAIVFDLSPGWYESRVGRSGSVEHFCVTRVGQIERIPTQKGRDALRRLGKAGKRGETIDDGGAFMSERCWCGGSVEFYTSDQGRPRCEAHRPDPQRKEAS